MTRTANDGRPPKFKDSSKLVVSTPVLLANAKVQSNMIELAADFSDRSLTNNASSVIA